MDKNDLVRLREWRLGLKPGDEVAVVDMSDGDLLGTGNIDRVDEGRIRVRRPFVLDFVTFTGVDSMADHKAYALTIVPVDDGIKEQVENQKLKARAIDGLDRKLTNDQLRRIIEITRDPKK